MFILKRNGKKEEVKLDKILVRVSSHCDDLKHVEPIKVAQKVVAGLYDGISSTKIDELLSETAALLNDEHPEYGLLAGRIAISAIHKETSASFYQTMKSLYKEGSLGDEFINKVKKYSKDLEKIIDYERDFNFDFFGVKTLMGKANQPGYLMRVNNQIVERPQHLFMRVAVAVADDDLKSIKDLYDLISQGYYTHATPTLFNAGHKKPQYASCFVKGTEVFTVNDGPKPIEDVKIGDLVVTHKNRIKPVVQLHKNLLNNRTVFEVKPAKSVAFKVTENHKFWSITKEQMGWKQSPQFNDMKSLRVGDYIAIPKATEGLDSIKLDLVSILEKAKLPDPQRRANMTYSFSFDDNNIFVKGSYIRKHKLRVTDSDNIIMTKKHNPFNRYLNIDKEFLFFLGCWYGDGCLFSDTHTSEHVRGLGITIHKDNKKLINRLKILGDKYLGLKGEVTKPAKDNTVVVRWHSFGMAIVFKELFGRGFDKKKIYKPLYSLKKENINQLLSGLITSDGCVTQDGDVRLGMCNRSFITSIYHLCRKNGIPVSISRSEKISYISFPKYSSLLKNIVKHYEDNRIKRALSKKEKNNHSIVIDGQTFLRIEKKNIVNISDKYVYTLGVEDDHSYMVEGVLAENCFLVQMESDSIEGIFNTAKEAGLISKHSGGIGIHVSNLRASGSKIRGNNGFSNGLVPWMKIFNEVARSVNQGGKRKGSIAMYLEPWHADVEGFLELPKEVGPEEIRARDLFLAMWMPDLFFKRAEENGDWSLMCPDECPGLQDVYGDEFEQLYLKYEAEGKVRKTIKARDLLAKICECQIEHGMPYVLAKDAINKKSNQKNIGVIKSSNLCAEIVEVSTEDETAVCNLASVALPKYVKSAKKEFDFKKLEKVVRIATRNLNNVIDRTFYPTDKTKKSNLRHRPIAIGVQGLADVFFMMDLPFESAEAMQLDRDIFETMYYAFLSESMELAKEQGPYETFKGSPASEGLLQFDMWNVKPSDRYDWNSLKEEIKIHGLRNSLGIALMPTASTASIFSNVEAMEPQKANLFRREVLSGEFMIVNKHLVKALEKHNLWNSNIRTKILNNRGSVQGIKEIPEDIQAVYKNAYELKQKVIIDHAAIRGPFIDQTQSMNLFFEEPKIGSLSSAMLYSWKLGLKTLNYYIRSKAKAKAAGIGLDKPVSAAEAVNCSIDNKEDCEVCSS